MIDRQHAVTFENASGQRLFGIVHEPLVSPRFDVGIILLSPGVKNRVAPHRLYNKMAAAYAALGFWVLRFDFYGLGDSEGVVQEPMLADLYGSIQTGRYADDTRCAVDWMLRTYGIQRVVVGGLCGGAITGVFAAAEDRRVAGILGLGIPVMLDSSRLDKVASMTAGQLHGVRRGYLRKLLRPSSWLRVLTLQTDFRLLVRSLFGSRPIAPPAARAAAAPAPPPASNANPHFPPAFLRILSDRRPVLLVFSGSDRLYAEYQEKFLPFHRPQLDRCADALDLVVVAEANHVFTFSAWQHEMLQRTSAWLQARFPAQMARPSEAAGIGGKAVSVGL